MGEGCREAPSLGPGDLVGEEPLTQGLDLCGAVHQAGMREGHARRRVPEEQRLPAKRGRVLWEALTAGERAPRRERDKAGEGGRAGLP